MESNFKAILLTPPYIILMIDLQEPCVNISVRVFSTIKETLAFPQQTFREEPYGKWWLTIYCRWYSHFLSLDTECEISIKVNKGRVTIWAYCLLSKTYTLQLPMAGCCSLPFCLFSSSFTISPFLALFTCYLSFSFYIPLLLSLLLSFCLCQALRRNDY